MDYQPGFSAVLTRRFHDGNGRTAKILTALRSALETHIPEIHHSDQGIQYAAYAYTDLLQAHGIQISMAAVGKAEENGYSERLIRTIKEEEVYLSEFRNFSDAPLRSDVLLKMFI